MAGKQIPRSKSRVFLLFTCTLLAFSILFFLLFSDPPLRSSARFSDPNPTARPETSFVASLDHFLTQKTPKSRPIRDDTASSPFEEEEEVKKLDDSMFDIETERLYSDPYYPVNLPLKVYVYEMPSKFTYDLLWLFRNTYKETSNLTSNGSPVHRLIEQHSIDYWLWADLIAPESERLLKSAVRVHKQDEADLFYIPFFTTISFFLLEKQQCKTLYRVKL